MDQSIKKSDPVKLRSAINKHMRFTLEDAFSALEIISKTAAIADEELKDIRSKTEGNDLPLADRTTIDVLTTEDGSFEKVLAQLLSEDFCFTGDNIEIEIFLCAGIRYYLKQIKDPEFYLFTDLPQLLTIDRRMYKLFAMCDVLAMTVPKGISEKKRQYESRLKKRGPKEKRWMKIFEILTEKNNDPKLINEKYSINRIAHDINRELATTTNTVINDFKEMLGKDVTRKEYYLSNLLELIIERKNG